MRRNIKQLTFLAVILIAALFSYRSISKKPEPSQSSLKSLKNKGMLKGEGDLYMPDPITGFTHRPHAKRHYQWAEHSGGSLDLTTNNMGFRLDRDTAIDKDPSALRTLVVGDSHMSGVLNNSENFSHLLEVRMAANNPDNSIEVLNAATGYFGPQHYLATLKKYLYLKPDIFIVIVFTGNDFADALKMIPDYDPNWHPDGYMQRLNEAVQIKGGDVLAQGLNQIYYFKYFPEMKEKSLQHSYDQFLQIKEICEKNKIKFFLVTFPTKMEVEPDKDKKRLSQDILKLQLNNDDMLITARMREKLGDWARNNKIEYLDSTEAFIASEETLFWNRDYHLSVSGHQVLADSFFNHFNKKLGKAN